MPVEMRPGPTDPGFRGLFEFCQPPREVGGLDGPQPRLHASDELLRRAAIDGAVADASHQSFPHACSRPVGERAAFGLGDQAVRRVLRAGGFTGCRGRARGRC